MVRNLSRFVIPSWPFFYFVEVSLQLPGCHITVSESETQVCLQTLLRENSGDFEQALRITVMCFRQPAKFYAEVRPSSITS